MKNESDVRDYHAAKALLDMKTVYDFVANKMKELQAPPPRNV